MKRSCAGWIAARGGVPNRHETTSPSSRPVAVVVIGEQQERSESANSPKDRPTDGEGFDVASLDLTGVQEDLIRAIYATGKPTIVVLINARPLSIRWTAAHVPVILQAWEPGERGGQAVAEIVFGDTNPSGKLAIIVPRHSGQLPAYYNYKPWKNIGLRKVGASVTWTCRRHHFIRLALD